MYMCINIYILYIYICITESFKVASSNPKYTGQTNKLGNPVTTAPLCFGLFEWGTASKIENPR